MADFVAVLFVLFVVFPVLIAIKDFLKKRKKEKEKEKEEYRRKIESKYSTPDKNDFKIPDNLKCYPKLEYILDLFFDMADEEKARGNIFLLQLGIPHVGASKGPFEVEITFVYTGGPLKYEELFSYFKMIDDCRYKYTIKTDLISTSVEHYTAILHTQLNDYTKKHSNRIFELESLGASIRYN